jgi:hypothetical protein
MDEKVLRNAIRVLTFFAEPSIIGLCEPFLKRNGMLGALAAFVPALVPAFSDRDSYEQRVLDRNIEIKERGNALSVLAALGATSVVSTGD